MFHKHVSSYRIYSTKNEIFFIKHCPPCTKKPLISEMCIYIKQLSVQAGSWYTGECSIDKTSKGCRLKTHKIHYSQWKLTSIVQFMIKE